MSKRLASSAMAATANESMQSAASSSSSKKARTSPVKEEEEEEESPRNVDALLPSLPNLHPPSLSFRELEMSQAIEASLHATDADELKAQATKMRDLYLASFDASDLPGGDPLQWRTEMIRAAQDAADKDVRTHAGAAAASAPPPLTSKVSIFYEGTPYNFDATQRILLIGTREGCHVRLRTGSRLHAVVLVLLDCFYIVDVGSLVGIRQVWRSSTRPLLVSDASQRRVMRCGIGEMVFATMCHEGLVFNPRPAYLDA